MQRHELLHDRYEIIEPLGSGGGGQSWKARDTRTGGLVVVKALHQPARDGVPREVDLLRQLDHPQVQRFVDAFVEEERMVPRLHLVTEWVEGRNLGDHAAARRLDQQEVERLVDDLLGVVIWLHGLSPPVLHRDIKPSNIVRTPDGRVVLIDFDLATEAIDRTFQHTMAAGTLGFQAPEQIAGDPCPASDVYSVGVTALQLWTRKLPATLLDGQKLDWRRAATHLSPARRAWLEQALAPELSERFSTAEEARRALRDPGRAPQRRRTSAAPAPAPSRAAPSREPETGASRTPQVLIGLAVAVCAIMGAAVSFILMGTSTEPAPEVGAATAEAPAAAVPLTTESCDAGHAEACLALARKHREGDVYAQVEAGNYFARACRLGSGVGCWEKAQAHTDNGWLRHDPQAAAEWTMEACALNVTNSCDVLRRLERSLEDGALEDAYARMVETLAEDCESFVPNSGSHLPSFRCGRAMTWLREGKAGRDRAAEAQELALVACGRGGTWACHEAAQALREGDGVPEDKAAAFALYSKTCEEQGDRTACDVASQMILSDEVPGR